MRYLAVLILTLALGVMACSESENDGGTAGAGGDSGIGGAAGAGGDGGSTGEGGAAGDGGVAGHGGSTEPASLCLEGLCPCSEAGIRDAIAEGGGPFTFDCDGPTTVVTKSQIDIDNDVSLDGEGRLTLDGGGTHRVFLVASETTAELRGFTIQGGVAPELPNGYYGGGLLNAGTLTLTDGKVSGNEAFGGGGISNRGNLTVIDSTVSDNTARNGGGFWNEATLALIGTTVSGNAATTGDGGGILNWSGFTTPFFDTEVTLISSTVSGNTARFSGGGIMDSGGIDPAGPVTLVNSTVSGNTTEAFSDIVGAVQLLNSLFEGECDPRVPVRLRVVSLGHNIESPGDTCGFNEPTDQPNVSAEDLKLGPLQDNGGPTQTHALGAGSVAIDLVPEEDCLDADGAPLLTDQRGEPRDTTCDIGAYELQP